jgi:hypothetical protein
VQEQRYAPIIDLDWPVWGDGMGGLTDFAGY